jgi:hypothetical protein
VALGSRLYRVDVNPSAGRALAALPRRAQERVAAALDALAETPRPHYLAREEMFQFEVEMRCRGCTRSAGRTGTGRRSSSRPGLLAVAWVFSRLPIPARKVARS